MEAFDNHIVLLGNIVSKQNTLKYFADGKAVLSLQLLTKRKWRDASGQWQEFANYFNVTVLGQQAEMLAKGAKPGLGLYVRAQLREKTLRNGNVVGVLEAQSVKLIDKASSVSWNQAHINGRLISHSALVQTINGQDLITLSINISESMEKEQLVDVKLKGATAKLIASQLTDQASGQVDVLVEGSVSSQSKKIADEFTHQYWIDGHTCVLSNLKAVEQR